MKKTEIMTVLCLVMLFSFSVHAESEENTGYIVSRDAVIRTQPSAEAEGILTIPFTTEVIVNTEENDEWKNITIQKANGESITGYVESIRISEEAILESCDELLEVYEDCDILDYPGRRDGQIIGEVLELDEVQRTGKAGDVWSQISFADPLGQIQTGYVLTSVLEPDMKTGSNETKKNAGVLSKSEGNSIFTDAEEEIGKESVSENEDGVKIGNSIAASSDSSLLPLGVFRITHYCSCSICCGPWANGITSTGRTAVTNHTIAVDPTQIPYGSKVVINGQVYVAEDCGGAIKRNCIDIYVASHMEGENKGVFYTDVYLIQE